MSSHKQRGRGYKGRVRAEPYRPWNAAALGKPTSGSIYNPVLEKFASLSIKDESMNNDRKYDGSKLRPWNAASLNKLDIENGSFVSINARTNVSPLFFSRHHLFIHISYAIFSNFFFLYFRKLLFHLVYLVDR